MADFQMKPFLQKPPGYRDPNVATTSPPPPPPISPQQQPNRKSAAAIPTSFRPKKKRRSCCRVCCCCICITLILLIFLLLVGIAVFYLWFDPKLPTFNLASFRLDGFKLSDGPDGASLSATAIARFEMKNPNSKLDFYYGNTDVEMSVGSGQDETGMGETTVNGFRQGPRNTTNIKVETNVRNQIVERGLAKRLTTKFQSKDLVINVFARTKVGLGVAGIKFGMLGVKVKCGGVSMNKLNTDSPKCTFNTLRWINIQ